MRPLLDMLSRSVCPLKIRPLDKAMKRKEIMVKINGIKKNSLKKIITRFVTDFTNYGNDHDIYKSK